MKSTIDQSAMRYCVTDDGGQSVVEGFNTVAAAREIWSPDEYGLRDFTLDQLYEPGEWPSAEHV